MPRTHRFGRQEVGWEFPWEQEEGDSRLYAIIIYAYTEDILIPSTSLPQMWSGLQRILLAMGRMSYSMAALINF